MRARKMRSTPFALSLSKGFSRCAAREVEGFDKLGPNGLARRRDFPSFETLS